MHLALEGHAPAPLLLLVSRICEEFHCTPTRALWELEHDPDQLVLSVIGVRNYERAKALVDQAVKTDKDDELPLTPLIEEVKANRFDLMAEEYQAKKAAAQQRAARRA